MTVRVKFINQKDFKAKEEKRLAEHDAFKKANPDVGDAWPAEKKAINDRANPPGMVWEAPWYFDPNSEKDQPRRLKALEEIKAGTFDDNKTFLSRHYWLDWSDKRPPICVITPNGEHWCPDQTSSNGTGWTVWNVENDYANLCCAPSIVVTGYHGFLNDGQFTADLDSHHPNGTKRDGTPA